jgi:hypothetical protein
MDNAEVRIKHLTELITMMQHEIEQLKCKNKSYLLYKRCNYEHYELNKRIPTRIGGVRAKERFDRRNMIIEENRILLLAFDQKYGITREDVIKYNTEGGHFHKLQVV